MYGMGEHEGTKKRDRVNILWWCAGVVPDTLRLYPTEKAKYEGIGGAVLTTGVLAFLSGFYAVYTTLASGPYGLVTSIGFGLLWGLPSLVSTATSYPRSVNQPIPQPDGGNASKRRGSRL